MRITQVGSGKGVVVVYYEGETVSGGFRDLTISCENFSLPATSQRPPAPTRTLCGVSALALLSLNFEDRKFVAATTYRVFLT